MLLLLLGGAKMNHILASVGEDLLAKALEVTVNEAEGPPLIVLELKLPSQEVTSNGCKLLLLQIKVVVPLNHRPATMHLNLVWIYKCPEHGVELLTLET